MSSPRIKKKAASSSGPAGMLPRQGAIPCLIIILLIIVGLSVLGFFALRSAG